MLRFTICGRNSRQTETELFQAEASPLMLASISGEGVGAPPVRGRCPAMQAYLTARRWSTNQKLPTQPDAVYARGSGADGGSVKLTGVDYLCVSSIVILIR
jgi:hypothetical protein